MMGIKDSRHIPTLGYPNQKAAIVALFVGGKQPQEIVEMIGCSINAVHRALSEYRKKHNIPMPEKRKPTPNENAASRMSTIWDMTEDKRREAIAARAAKAARKARLAA